MVKAYELKDHGATLTLRNVGDEGEGYTIWSADAPALLKD